MKVHTTNYRNAFIMTAEDCPADMGEVPPVKGDKKTVANMQFDMLIDNPYKYTSDDVLFAVYAVRNELPKSELRDAREVFFSKGQPCMRTSPLTKRYGWGVHSNEDGKIALYACETEEYRAYATNVALEVVRAMKQSR